MGRVKDEWGSMFDAGGSPPPQSYSGGPSYSPVPKEYREFEYILMKVESSKAWLLVFENGAEVWFPKSQCALYPKKKTVDVPAWLYNQKKKEIGV